MVVGGGSRMAYSSCKGVSLMMDDRYIISTVIDR